MNLNYILNFYHSYLRKAGHVHPLKNNAKIYILYINHVAIKKF